MMVGAGEVFRTAEPGLTLVSVSWIVNDAGSESAPSEFCTYTTYKPGALIKLPGMLAVNSVKLLNVVLST